MQRRQWMMTGLAAAAMLAAPALAQAQEVVVGVSISATGPAASLGIAEKQTLEMAPKTLGGKPVRYVILDDATDPSNAAKNAHRLVDVDKVDVIIGSTAVPASLAIAEVAAQTKTPQIALAPFAAKPEQLPWVFSLPQSVSIMAGALFDHMKAKGVKTVGYIGFSDAWGEAWLKETNARAEALGIKVVAVERYARSDTSVTAQTLKLVSAQPDVVLVGASGSPAALPMRALRERGFKGQIYQTHGVANNDFLRVSGEADEGAILPSGPVLVAEMLPDSHPAKAAGVAYAKSYEAKYGPGSRNNFGAYANDAVLVLDKAVATAAAKTKPGTPEFRQALRDAIEGTKGLAVSHGVITMSPQDHSGFDQRSRVLLSIQKNTWQLVK